MRILPRSLQGFVGLAALVLMAGCGSSHHLHEYDFTDATVAVVANIPPRPLVFTDAPYDARVDPKNPIGSFFRAGTALIKHAEAREAQQRMDSALAYVDVAERVARRALRQSAGLLGYRPVDRPADADYVLDIHIADYGLVADSWEAAVHFEIRAEMVLVDRRTRRTVWRKRVREVEPGSDALLGLGPSFGNIYTAVTLSRLTTEQMITALEHLADYTAERLTEALRHDYYATR